MQNRAHLLIACQDRPGIVAAISQFLFERGANIIQSDQYTMDPEGGMFFIRLEFDLPKLWNKLDLLKKEFKPIAERFHMDWNIHVPEKKKRMAIFVSKEDHCLLELLWQWKREELHAEIPLVISNHLDMQATVEGFGIPYVHIPVTAQNKQEEELQQLDILKKHNIDVVVLARYMQILSTRFLERYRNRVINIHHSFLPAFVGGKPYHQAYERGVKIIGATAHYVTEDLDEGPIIEQDVARVSHRYSVEELKRIGRNIERVVLARAVSWHLENRIIIHKNKTIVF